MIVVLSNEFEGGELLVRHGAREEEFEFEDAAAGKAPCYAAFLWRLQQVKKTKRTLNQLAGGIITIGSVPAPIQPYSGPTTRGTIEKASEMVSEAVPSVDEEESLRNVSRGDRRCTFRNELSPNGLFHVAIERSLHFSASEFWRLAES